MRIDDGVYAYEDLCPHQGAMLSSGSLDGCVIQCKTHDWRFDACSGRGVNPSDAQLKVFRVKLEGDAVLVELNEAAR